jgi:hypothetical protein
MTTAIQDRPFSVAVIQAEALSPEQAEGQDGLVAAGLQRWPAASEPAGQGFDPGLSWPLGKVFL